PLLPLIQMRQDHLELRRQHRPHLIRDRHNRSTKRNQSSNGLFSYEPERPVNNGRRDQLGTFGWR
ncbi:hypothetical protein, partial [Actinoplanes awajinensis]|uniref:hypothetical protein n=1 Tax=Actinoplanes awajinensis TaxID=135946 RepID=UPI001E3F9E6F